ncbi:hypothetical protein IAG41_04670 [Sphingomonas sp. JC676]|uniref:hypothetical protein n=1 Tax=Sphingomonas sp. JC676 TaxID=2768065 RepID=UPI001657C99F|nr:hypothetical protein [Sphingomonas sp. JC676]MBC9031678.1 hypothetical protein [Sphingomonas sp. JC676]
MTESLADPLALTPVAARARHDGWTAQRQRDFIAALAELGVVGTAAKSVGMSPKSAYALRIRAGEDSNFAAAWDAAIDMGRFNAIDTGIQRALSGVAVPVFYRGRQIGVRRVFNDSLLIAALRATDPGFRGAPTGPDAEWNL